MLSDPANFIPYAIVREAQKSGLLRHYELPVEHEKSFPVPSLRYSAPTFVSFASPCLRNGGECVVAAPDRWWSVDARTGGTMLYALCRIQPPGNFPPAPVTLAPAVGTSVAEVIQRLKRLDAAMDAPAAAFFRGDSMPLAERSALRGLLGAVVHDELLPFYRVLAPDFFTWLEAGLPCE